MPARATDSKTFLEDYVLEYGKKSLQSIATSYEDSTLDTAFTRFLVAQYSGRLSEQDLLEQYKQSVATCSIGISQQYDTERARQLREEWKCWLLTTKLSNCLTDLVSRMLSDHRARLSEFRTQSGYMQIFNEGEIIALLREFDDRLAINDAICDWLEEIQSSALTGDPNRNVYATQTTYVGWESTIEAVTTARRSGLEVPTLSLIADLDPDAPIREEEELTAQDDMEEKRLSLELYSLLRQGRLSDAISLCTVVRQFWKAAILKGGECYYDRHLLALGDDVIDESGLEEAMGRNLEKKRIVEGSFHGNMHRSIWKKQIWSASNQNKIDRYEKALYGVLSGNLEAVLPVCDGWDDALWANLRTTSVRMIEAELNDKVIANDSNFMDTSDTFSGLEIDFNNLFSQLNNRYETSHFEEIQEALVLCHAFVYHAAQNGLRDGQTKAMGVIEDLFDRITRNMDGIGSELDIVFGSDLSIDFLTVDLLRFYVHLLIYLRRSEWLSSPEARRVLYGPKANVVLSLYIRRLLESGNHHLVFMYVALMTDDDVKTALITNFLKVVVTCDLERYDSTSTWAPFYELGSYEQLEIPMDRSMYRLNLVLQNDIHGSGSAVSEFDFDRAIEALHWIAFTGSDPLLLGMGNRLIRVCLLADYNFEAATKALAKVLELLDSDGTDAGGTDADNTEALRAELAFYTGLTAGWNELNDLHIKIADGGAEYAEYFESDLEEFEKHFRILFLYDWCKAIAPLKVEADLRCDVDRADIWPHISRQWLLHLTSLYLNVAPHKSVNGTWTVLGIINENPVDSQLMERLFDIQSEAEVFLGTASELLINGLPTDDLS
eukprot:Clim_evm67s142 gene=Clim_evmTU67s142